ncbi:MAG: hypothetical protein BWK73_09625 [Thiothrix lacustris]|uniref:Uncharacterized protein n=1 Tax=Thiothrix lacustris TaxID=525917 RepID=A0A1Y1QUT9_9GAMM|nr:MAG: hypothetical protein BWK73_09625 [Thiothrix lacustris]
MFEEPVDAHEYLSKVEIPKAPPMPIHIGGCSRSHGNLQRIEDHYAHILATVLAEPDDITRIRKLFYLMLEARNQWSFCGWSFQKLLPHVMAVPVTEALLAYLARFAASRLDGDIHAFVVLKECLSGNIPLDCPSCGASLQNSLGKAGHVCAGCYATIPANHFTQSQWHKCTCGKMTHVSASGLVCTCGMRFTSNELKTFTTSTEKKIIKMRIHQTLIQAGLAQTALDGIMAP